jgi:MFS family permease
MNVVGSVVINMTCYGMTQSFGVFQQYYENELLPDQSAMAISWIGAINSGLCPMLGCISGPLFDAGYLKHLTIAGGGLYTFGLMMASISKEYYQVLLAHGICAGIGMGTMFSPSVATLSHHFARSRHRNLVFGFQACGSAVAGIYLPITLNYMLPAIGFGWSMRVLAFIVMLFTAIGFFTLSTTVPPRKELAILSPSVYRNKAYSTFLVGASLCVLAIYAPFTFGVTYATSRGVPVGIANYAPAISNGVSIIGRTVPLIVAARTGPINVLMTFAIASGVMQMFWTLTKTTPTIMVYLGIYGITSGGYGASLNPGAASFAPHVNQVGTPIQFSPKLPLTCTRLGCISACASSPRPGSGWLARRSSPSSSTIIPTTCPPLCLAGVS